MIELITKKITGKEEKQFTIKTFKKHIESGESEIKFYRPYIKVPDIKAFVPDYLPNSKKRIDEEKEATEEKIKTWEEWVGKNYTTTESEGFYYFLSYAGTGKSLKANILVKLLEDGIELVDEKPEQPKEFI